MAVGISIPNKQGLVTDSNPFPVKVIGSATADTLSVLNVTMATADTEYSQVLPENTRAFFLKLRSQAASFKLAFRVGESGTNYITVPANGYLYQTSLNLEDRTVYFQSPSANQTMEIIVYS